MQQSAGIYVMAIGRTSMAKLTYIYPDGSNLNV